MASITIPPTVYHDAVASLVPYAARMVISKLADHLTCSVEEAMEMVSPDDIIVNSGKGKSMKKRASKEPKQDDRTPEEKQAAKDKMAWVRSHPKKKGSDDKPAVPAVPLPWCEKVMEDQCRGLKVNHSLYTQCPQKIGTDSNMYCTTCSKQADGNDTGKPTHGTVEDRLAVDLMEYRSPSGKQVLPYANVIEKLNISRENAEAEAAKFDMVIAECQWEKVEKKRGRPKKESKSASTEDTTSSESEGDDPKQKRRVGRPSKKASTLEETPISNDLIAKALKQHIDGATTNDSGEQEAQTPTIVKNKLSLDEKAKRKAKKAKKAKRKAEEAAAMQKKAEEDAAMQKKADEEAAMQKKAEEEAAMLKKVAEEAEKQKKDEEAESDSELLSEEELESEEEEECRSGNLWTCPITNEQYIKDHENNLYDVEEPNDHVGAAVMNPNGDLEAKLEDSESSSDEEGW